MKISDLNEMSMVQIKHLPEAERRRLYTDLRRSVYSRRRSASGRCFI